MKNLSKILMLLAAFTVGTYVAAWAVPVHLMGRIDTFTGIMTIAGGGLGGMFLGGLLVLLWD